MVPRNRILKTSWLLLTAIASGGLTVPALAQHYKVIYSFTDGPDGARPVGGIIQDKLGNLYGETEYGGSPCIAPPGVLGGTYGCGTVYKVDSTGAFTTLVTFDHSNGTFGEGPLTLVGSTLYGTTYNGGPGLRRCAVLGGDRRNPFQDLAPLSRHRRRGPQDRATRRAQRCGVRRYHRRRAGISERRLWRAVRVKA